MRSANGVQLQAALDSGSREDVLELAAALNGHVDRIEVGTPLVFRFGAPLVTAVKAACPDCAVMADFKIVDAGEHEAEIAFDAGADLVTVLAAADDETISGCLEAAARYGKQVTADLIGLDDPPSRVAALQCLGVHEVCVHTGVDRQRVGDDPLAVLRAVREVATVSVAVAGGITLETLAGVLAYRPDVVIVGAGITSSADPVVAAAAMGRVLAEGIR